MLDTPEILATIKQAQQEKIVNKTRELEREQRSEVLGRANRRRHIGLPAHASCIMFYLG